jgi:diguanylate cyclase (GGDEF)-like protein/PAS domain S-box-containing protein
MKKTAKKNFASMVSYSLFFSSLAFLVAGSLLVGLSKLFSLNGNIYNVILPLNGILLLACSALSLIAALRKQTPLLIIFLSIMLGILCLSSPFLSTSSIAMSNMPWLQLSSWLLLIIGLIGRSNCHHAVWHAVSLVSFSLLATLMIALLLVNTGTLGELQFGVSPSVSLNTAIFLLFAAIAGLTVTSASSFNMREHRPSIGSLLSLLLTIASLLLWLNFMQQIEVANQKVVKETVLKFQQQTELTLEGHTGLMKRLADRLSATNMTYLPHQLSLDIDTYLRDFSYLDYIAVMDKQGKVYYSAAQSNPIKQWYDTYLVSEQALLSTHLNSPDNERVSYYYNDQIDHTFVKVKLPQPNALGLSSVMAGINFKHVMQSTIPLIVPTGYAINLAYEKNSELLLSQLEPHRQYFKLGDYIVKSIADINWRLQLFRDFDVQLNYVRQVSEVILIAGWLACLLALLSQQYQKQIQWQQRQLIVTNKSLRKSLSLQQKLQTDHQQFMQNSADLLCILDGDGRFLEVSDSSLMVLGYTAKELEGRVFKEFVHPDDTFKTNDEADTLLKGNPSQNFRNRYIRKDGNVVHLLWSCRYIPGIDTIYAVAKDITDFVKGEHYKQSQQQILRLISAEAPLDEILTQICLMAEEYNPGVKACVMLKVNEQLQIASAPSLSDKFYSALADLPIADNVGSCGTSAFRRRPVIVEDIAVDPKWEKYADLALAEDLRACWSIPMLLNEDTVLGTFSMYCTSPRTPEAEELEVLVVCGSYAANAIERSQQKRLLTESEQRFRSLYQFNPDPVFVLDSQGYFTEINTPGCELLDWTLSELKRMHFSQVVAREKLDEVSHYFDRTLSGEPESFETSIISHLGAQHELQVTIIPTWIDGHVVGVIGMAKDITQRLQTEKQLRLFKRGVDASSNGVIITDITQPDMPISYVNYSFEKLTGYSKEESIGKNCRFLQGKERDEVALGQIRSAIATKQEVSVVLKNFRKDGSAFWNNLYLSPVPDDYGVITHYIGIQTDITEQKQYERELAFNASHDLLTGLPNRSLLQDRLSQSLKISVRHQQKVAVLFINLDGFKLINDSLGHLIGDDVLRQISVRLQHQIRPGDTLARLSGDEFVILLPDLNETQQLNVTARNLLTTIASPLTVCGRELKITASIGISLSGDIINDPKELVKQADLAMDQAKQLGRNNVQWYNPEMKKNQNNRLDLRVMLQQALVNQEFELYYQAQVEAGSGQLIGLEALIRWQHPQLGVIGPDEFIPIAEEMGLIVELGQWVIEEAASYNRSLQERGIVELIMAVNLSSLQFQRQGFVEQLEQTLKRVKLAPKWFELEMTESLLLANIEEVVLKLQELKQLGVGIAIDDFGTGYSSLNYLKRLPIDKLKIDKSFIRELVTDQKDAAIVRAIIAMAHQLGVKVIAEGVETIAQASLLHKSFCDELQGYYFSKPLPAEKLEVFLQHYLPADKADAGSEQKNLLLIDDEENILHSLKRMLRKESFNIITCQSAAEAFEVLALHNVQVIVSDQRMPEMSGTEFLSRVKEMYPDTIRLVLSGYTDLRSVTDAINHGAIYKFITKPWQDDDLKNEIVAAFKLYQQQQIKQ